MEHERTGVVSEFSPLKFRYLAAALVALNLLLTVFSLSAQQPTDLQSAFSQAASDFAASNGARFVYEWAGATAEAESGVVYAYAVDLTTRERIPQPIGLVPALLENGVWRFAFPGDPDYQASFERVSPLVIMQLDVRPFESASGNTVQVSNDFRLPWAHGRSATVTRSYNLHGTGQIDFDLDSPAEIVAAKDGVIIYVNDSNWQNTLSSGAWWYWNTVVIQHAVGEYTTYAHVAQNSVPAWIKSGCSTNYASANCSVPVRAGQVIALEGNTGQSSGPHLHYTVGTQFIANTYNGVPTGYGWNLVSAGFQGYNVTEVAAWPYGRRLQASYTPTPFTNFVANGDFALSLRYWAAFAQPTQSAITSRINSGVLEFRRAPGSASAVMLQNTGAPLPSGAPINATFLLGNSSPQRQRATVILHDNDFSDLLVCSFWLPPNSPPQPYGMETQTTEAWTQATVAIYASTPVTEGWLRVDDVWVQHMPGFSFPNTICRDFNAPG
jgi:murein DD-endopeptidase MepM/ murein hydrolase activator NlpD